MSKKRKKYLEFLSKDDVQKVHTTSLAVLEETGVIPHTINYSFGVWGKKELLPNKNILAITTMCGHHIISPRLVERLIEDVKKEETTSGRAAERLTQMCPCGIFNQVRAEKLIQKMADK